ncbi:MAG: nucleoside triphosphate pyrophosphohydrolase family protein [Candidatus Paceibacterota bacterium]
MNLEKKSYEDCIREFHEVFSLQLNEEPNIKLLELRKTLIEEEVKEFFSELDSAILKLKNGEEIPKELYLKMLKELADVQVVLSGTVVSLRPFQNFREAFLRVHISNMSKLGEDGKPLYREDGKVQKGPSYQEPNLDDLV